MSGVDLTPTTAEELLAFLRQTIAQTRDSKSRPAAVCVATAQGESVFVLSTRPANVSDLAAPVSPTPAVLHSIQADLEAQAERIGSLPPTPSTLRGYIGISLIRGMNRLLWWQSNAQKNFARMVCEVTRPLVQQYQQYGSLTAATSSMQQRELQLQQRDLQLQHMLERLGNVERQTQQLERSSTESRVIARFESRMSSLEAGCDDVQERLKTVEEIAATHRQKAKSL